MVLTVTASDGQISANIRTPSLTRLTELPP
jgi:hypothetical protein